MIETTQELLEIIQKPPTYNGIVYPVANTYLVRRDLVVANNYNPNSVSLDKMNLLKQSILDNGFAFPVVTIYDKETDKFVIIDGFHRFTIAGKKWLDLPCVPIVVLEHNIAKRMVATVQFNKARGHHQVDLDASIVKSLIEQNMSEEEIAQHLGLELEAIHRYKQLTGIADLFKNTPYSMSWNIQEVNDDEMEIR